MSITDVADGLFVLLSGGLPVVSAIGTAFRERGLMLSLNLSCVVQFPTSLFLRLRARMNLGKSFPLNISMFQK